MLRRDSGEKTKKFMVYLMSILMVGSLFGIIFFGFQSGGRASNTISYNDFEFVNQGTFWSTNVNGIPAAFTFLPTDLELILADNEAINSLKNKVQIDLTSDFNDTFAEGISLAIFQMGSTIINFNIFLRSGFTESESTYPVITCTDASATVPVIYFKSANFTKISLENNCIIAEISSNTDAIRVKDRLVYGMFDIIK